MPAGGKFGAGSYRYLPARSVFIQISEPHGQETHLMANVTVNVNRFVFIPVRASHARLFGACGGVSGGEGPEHETKVRQSYSVSNFKTAREAHAGRGRKAQAMVGGLCTRPRSDPTSSGAGTSCTGTAHADRTANDRAEHAVSAGDEVLHCRSCRCSCGGDSCGGFADQSKPEAVAQSP